MHTSPAVRRGENRWERLEGKRVRQEPYGTTCLPLEVLQLTFSLLHDDRQMRHRYYTILDREIALQTERQNEALKRIVMS
jgi:hypothetical protein